MPYCGKCGSEYKEGTKFCNECGNELSKGKTVTKHQNKTTPKPEETQKTKNFSWRKLIKGTAIVFLIFYIIMFFAGYGRQSKVTIVNEAVGKYNDYMDVINNDIEKINSVRNKYPEKMSNDEYITYANDYTVEATYFRQHLLEFKDFINENEDSLRDAGVNTIEKKAWIDNNLAVIDKNARQIQGNLQEIQESKEMTSNILKALAGLFL